MKDKVIQLLKRVWPVLRWILLALLIIGVAVGIWAGYTYKNDWTGFNDYQPSAGVRHIA